TKRGKETAVVVSVEEWRRAAGADEPTLKDLLTADDRRTVIKVPPRGRLLHRPLTRVA
ncbi:MAG: type II toxin-antitoxin system Phd/YefM family antitoxin, partial [Bifidobacteriaceae bacterium]|nr:type II toxin-antitoxin system Phd/YefM family antitoxin [Bifidobacteriaceae bacterium]